MLEIDSSVIVLPVGLYQWHHQESNPQPSTCSTSPQR